MVFGRDGSKDVVPPNVVLSESESTINPQRTDSACKKAWREMGVGIQVAELGEQVVEAVGAQGREIANFLGSNLSRQAAWFMMPKGVKWQWSHKSGFRDYSDDQNQKIELAYLLGHSKVRLRSGKKSSTPMEVYFIDMLQHDPTTGNTREVRRLGPASLQFRLRRLAWELWHSWYTGLPWRETFAQYQLRRKNLEQGVTEKAYDVFDYYHTRGCAQRIARSHWFFIITMAIVLLNALWLWYDLDANTATIWTEADFQFQFMENFFCVVFTFDLVIRFLAFAKKRDAFNDKWFRFDFLLVLLMVIETWILPVIFLSAQAESKEGGGRVRSLSILRILRLARLARAARLLRAAPELVTLLRGIFSAMRSLLYTALLLVILLFIFSILFRTQVLLNPVDDAELAAKYFPDCITTFWVLVAYGTLLDSPSTILVQDLVPTSWVLTGFFLVFMLLSSFTVLNMLIGIVCEVISQVKREEEETSENFYLRNNLLDIMDCYDTNCDQKLGMDEYKMLMCNPEAVELITKFGTDVNGLKTITDILYEKDVKLPFEDFIATVMRLRGAHPAKVTDLIEVREYTRHRFDGIEHLLKPLLEESKRNKSKDATSSRSESQEPSASASTGSPRELKRAKQGSRGNIDDGLPVKTWSPTKDIMVDVRLHLQGESEILVERHKASTTIGDLLLQVDPAYGRRRAADAANVMMARNLTIRNLVDAAGGNVPLDLYLVPDPWVATDRVPGLICSSNV